MAIIKGAEKIRVEGYGWPSPMEGVSGWLCLFRLLSDETGAGCLLAGT